MKITWLTTRHPPDKGGMALSSERLVNSLRDRGFPVLVIHLTQTPQSLLSSVKGKPFPGNRITENWNRVMVTGINAPMDHAQLFRFAEKQMKDSILIGFGGGLAGYLATLWAKWMGLKSGVLFRGNDFDKNIHDTKRAWLVHFILDHANVIGAVSREMVQRIRSLRNGPTIFTPNGIDITEWTFLEKDFLLSRTFKNEHLSFSQEKPVIGIYGQLKSKKGLELMAKLFESFQFNEMASLLTVGDIEDTMAKRLEECCRENWVHVPFQKKEMLPVYYAVSDVVCIPSFYDGMPNVLLEAMALGKVVVGSNTGGIPDVIRDGENGFLFENGDCSHAFEVLKRAMEMPVEKRQQIEENARETIVSHFTPSMEAEIIEEMIHMV